MGSNTAEGGTDWAQEIRALQERLDGYRRAEDPGLAPYRMSLPPVPPGLYWKMRWLAGWTLRLLETLGLKSADPWPVRLKDNAVTGQDIPVMIWAVGAVRTTLRAACEGFGRIFEAEPQFVPILVTDVVDFAFFSRLGWLVEFVPPLTGQSEAYPDRKTGYIAMLYSDLPVVPYRLGLQASISPSALRDLLATP